MAHFPVPYRKPSAHNTPITRCLSLFQDYLFALLTGYRDPPAGVNVGEGQHYNPYFPGGSIGMAQALYNEIIEYEDGKLTIQLLLQIIIINFLLPSG